MAKICKRIEIVITKQPGLSSMGSKSAAGVQAALSKWYEQVDVTIVNNMADLRALAVRGPDLAFLGMKFLPSNEALGLADPHKIWLSDFLDDAEIAYTGSDYPAVELDLNKDHAKQVLLDAGLATSRFMVVRTGERLLPGDVTLNYPLFVKPTNRGGGTGVDVGSMVHTFSELQAKVSLMATQLETSDALIEEYLPGREFSVAILRHRPGGEYLTMPLELIAPPNASGARFLSGAIKSADTESHLAVADGELKTALNTLAMNAFNVFGAQDYGRIDMRLDAAGTPHFLETNLLPSLLDKYGNFPKACRLYEGISHEAMLLRIVDLALYRHQSLTVDVPVDETLRGTDLLQPALI